MLLYHVKSWEPKLFAFVLNGLMFFVFRICVQFFIDFLSHPFGWEAAVFFYYFCQPVCEAALVFPWLFALDSDQVTNLVEKGLTKECLQGT